MESLGGHSRDIRDTQKQSWREWGWFKKREEGRGREIKVEKHKHKKFGKRSAQARR